MYCPVPLESSKALFTLPPTVSYIVILENKVLRETLLPS